MWVLLACTKEARKKMTECAKFHGSCAIVGLVLCCHRAFVGSKSFLMGISWVQDFFSWVFRGSEICFRGYFVGPTFFLVGIFRGSKILSCRYFVGPTFFSWVWNFFLWNKRIRIKWGIRINKYHTPASKNTK